MRNIKKMNKSLIHTFTIPVVLLLAFALTASAQTAGTLKGTLTDETGSLIPGATVTVTGSGNVKKSTGTDANGVYSVAGLPAGTYTIHATSTGFAPADKKVDLAPGAVATADFALKVAMANQQVTVQGEVVNTVTVDPSQNAGQLVLKGDDLMALSDDPDELASDLQALAGPAAGPNGGQIYIDGFSNAQLPPKESIREIRINSNPFAAEYDRLGFGRIEIFTKPGTDKFHGSGQFGFSDGSMNSRNPYSTNKPAYQLRQYEGNLGGPLSKKASFFLSLERREIDDNAIINATTLDSNLNPLTIAQAVLTPNRRLSIAPRIDYQLTQNITLVARYNFTDSSQDNAGIGGLRQALATQAYNQSTQQHTFQLTETAVLSPKAINETRFQFSRASTAQQYLTPGYSVNVIGNFIGGGSGEFGHNGTDTNHYEVTNTTSIAKGKHAIKFGARFRYLSESDTSPSNFAGAFTFGAGKAPQLDANNQIVTDASGNPVLINITSLERYRRTLLFQQMGLTGTQIRTLGGGATQFTLAGGNPLAAVNQFDAGPFVQDDWRVRPNLTLSLGLRYETQTNIHDWHDFAPRIGVAWSPDSKGAKNGKTVIRGGFGMFYDRWAQTATLTTERFNGVTQQQYVVANPDFFPTVPSISSIGSVGGVARGQTIYQIDPNARAPYMAQSAIGVERQLPKNTTVAVTFTNSHGVHSLLTRNISAPYEAPGTILTAGNAFNALATANIYQYESAGLMNQNQLITNVNSRLTRNFTLFTFYVFNHAKSNTDGLGTFPSNQYDLAAEYARAQFDIRHRFVLGSSFTTKYAIRFSPFIMANSGAPFNITTGTDLNGDSIYTDRPAFASDPTKPGVVSTKWGLLDPNPTPGEKIIPRNYGTGPAYFSVNMRVSRTWGFGEPRGSNANAANNGGGGPGGGNRGPGGGGGGRGGGGGGMAMGGGGMRGMFGGDTTNHRYNLTLSFSARNLLNTVNPGAPIGSLSSNTFGQSNGLSSGGGPGGGGGGSAANNRRLEVMLRFSF
jgi:hypothetical protein